MESKGESHDLVLFPLISWISMKARGASRGLDFSGEEGLALGLRKHNTIVIFGSCIMTSILDHVRQHQMASKEVESLPSNIYYKPCTAKMRASRRL